MTDDLDPTYALRADDDGKYDPTPDPDLDPLTGHRVIVTGGFVPAPPAGVAGPFAGKAGGLTLGPGQSAGGAISFRGDGLLPGIIPEPLTVTLRSLDVARPLPDQLTYDLDRMLEATTRRIDEIVDERARLNAEVKVLRRQRDGLAAAARHFAKIDPDEPSVEDEARSEADYPHPEEIADAQALAFDDYEPEVGP